MRAAMIGGVGYAGARAGANAAAKSQQQEQQGGEAAPPAAAPPPASETDKLSALSQLKTLLDSGALTQAEFDAQKQRILYGG
jgi:membrane protease subunit (stomatin/prohibitin family)